MDASERRSEELDAVLTEFTERLRRGELPAVEEYVTRLPDREEELVELFDAVRQIEELKQRRRLAAIASGSTPAGPRDTRLRPGSATLPAECELALMFHPPRATDEIGRLGPYRVLELLGSGGMGAVFLAEDPRLGRQVALKVLLPDLANTPEARARFLREARCVASLSHDHIVPVFDADEDRGIPYLTMPLLRGQTLETRLNVGPPLGIAHVLKIAREIAEGLAAAHERGLIHRDVKPANVWLESEGAQAEAPGRVKLLDFGLVCPAADGSAHLTQDGTAVGTPAYMAPEQARGEPVDARSDLFSLGVVLYRLCTGELPFQGRTSISVLMALAAHTPPPVNRSNPAVPPALAELVGRLLSKDPARRPATAREVVTELQGIQHRPTCRAGRPHRLPVPGGLLAAVAVVAAFGVWLGWGVFRGGTGEWTAFSLPDMPGDEGRRGGPEEMDGPLGDDALLAALASSEWEWSEPVNLGPQVNYVGRDYSPCVTADGLTLVFGTDRMGRDALFQARRTSPEEPFGPATPIAGVGNGSYFNHDPFISSDGRTLLFCSPRGRPGVLNLYVCSRARREAPWGPPTLLDVGPVPSRWRLAAKMSADELNLVFTAEQGRDSEQMDLWICSRKSLDAPFGPARPFGPEINTPNKEEGPSLHANGRLLLFQRSGALCFSTRPSASAPFGPVRPLGPPHQDGNFDAYPFLSANGRDLYFSSRRPEATAGDIFVSRLRPRPR